jgi:hypothetical protein
MLKETKLNEKRARKNLSRRRLVKVIARHGHKRQRQVSSIPKPKPVEFIRPAMVGSSVKPKVQPTMFHRLVSFVSGKRG